MIGKTGIIGQIRIYTTFENTLECYQIKLWYIVFFRVFVPTISDTIFKVQKIKSQQGPLYIEQKQKVCITSLQVIYT